MNKVHHSVLSMGYNAWSNMHRCPFVTRHNLTSKAVGKDMNMPSIIVAKYVPSNSYCACTFRVGCNIGSYRLYTGSCVVIDPLGVQLVLALGSLVVQWVSI